MKVIFACAGTGGHVNPAIAIANEIKKRENNTQILFIGTKEGIENRLTSNSGYDIKHIRTGKILRKLTLKNIKAINNAYKGISDAKKIIKEFKPDIIIGTGGYICVPVMLAAKKCKIPYILHESNAFPGMSVKLLSSKASKVLIGFKEAEERLKRKDNVVYTGTPAKFVRKDIENLDKQDCRKIFGLENITKKIVLVMCGSQGARKVNNIVIDMLEEYPNNDFYIIMVTGEKNYDLVVDRIKKIEQEKNIDLSKNIKLERFIFDMDKLYKAVDVCITRAGALTVTELAIAKKPSVLIPLPYATENHQFYNAKVLENIHAGFIIEEKDLSPKSLFDKLNIIAKDSSINKIEENLEKLNNEDVENNIYRIIKEVVG